MRTKVFVTAKGAEMKENSWIEGQEVEMSSILAKDFIENGIVSETLEVKKEVIEDPKKEVKQKKLKN